MKAVRRGWQRLWWVLILLVLSADLPGWAEARQVLGLEQLIGMALEKSPELQEAEQDIRAARSDLDQARAGRWAQLEVIGIVGPAEDAKEPIVDVKSVDGALIGHIKDRDEDSVGIFGRLDLALVQPLYTFGKIGHRKEAAALGVEAQKASKEKKRSEIIRDVKQLYYGLIVARQGLGAADDADAFIGDARSRIKRLIDLGSTNVNQNDLYRLETSDAEIQQFKAKARSGAQLAYLALKRAVGYPAAGDFDLDARELPKDPKVLDAQEAYIRKALDQRPEFEQLDKGIEARKALVGAAQADLYPSFFAAAFGSFAGAPGREKLDNSYFPDGFNHAYAGAVLGTQWHFDFGIGRARVDKARAEYEKLRYTREYAERSIPLEVAKYYQDAQEARASFEAYARAATAARKWIVSAFADFDIGVGRASDMFDAIDRYGKSQGEYLLALYNYHVALANLDYAAGEARPKE